MLEGMKWIFSWLSKETKIYNWIDKETWINDDKVKQDRNNKMHESLGSKYAKYNNILFTEKKSTFNKRMQSVKNKSDNKGRSMFAIVKEK